MARPQLRIYYGPEPTSAVREGESRPSAGDTVTVSVRDVLPILAEAARSQRMWLDDFADNEIVISADLYEVLLAYEHLSRRPSA